MYACVCLCMYVYVYHYCMTKNVPGSRTRDRNSCGWWSWSRMNGLAVSVREIFLSRAPLDGEKITKTATMAKRKCSSTSISSIDWTSRNNRSSGTNQSNRPTSKISLSEEPLRVTNRACSMTKDLFIHHCSFGLLSAVKKVTQVKKSCRTM